MGFVRYQQWKKRKHRNLTRSTVFKDEAIDNNNGEHTDAVKLASL